MGAQSSDHPAPLQRALQVLRVLVTGGYFVAVMLAVFLPIYTDEIGWRFQERAGFDGVDKMFSDNCGANSLAAPPWFMWPVREFSATLNALFAAPPYVRLSGVLYALVWGAILVALIRRVASNATDRLTLGIIGFGLMCLGTTPLLMVMSRPEQPLLVATTLAMMMALPTRADGHTRTDTGTAAAWLRSLLVLALAIITLSYHLKGLFLAPVFLLALAMASRGRAAIGPRVVVGMALVAITAVSARYWADRLACPHDAVLRAEYARNSAGALLVDVHRLSDLPPLLAGLWRNANLLEYVSLAKPEPWPLSEWLPKGQVTEAVSMQWDAALRRLWSLALGLGLIALLVAAWRGLRARTLDARLVMVAGLLVTLLGWAATRLVRNFYEGGFMLPLMMLAVVLALSAAGHAAWLRLARAALAIVIGVAALVSIVMTVQTWRPSLIQSWLQAGYVQGQGHSIAFRRFNGLRRDILGAAKLCAIPDPAHAKGLMVDDLTYFPFMTSHLPQHYLGVLGVWRGEITDPVAYLKSRNSDGIIVSCVVLPPDLRARARRQGNFCCLAPPGW